MRAYCITLTRMPKSVAHAERCRESARPFGLEVEIFDAVDRVSSEGVFRDQRLPLIKYNHGQSDEGAVRGCFASHFLLWQRCVELDEPVLVLEHDAVVVGAVPDPGTDGPLMINVGKRGWGEDAIPDRDGILPLGTPCFRGTHGYVVNPAASRRLIEHARRLPILRAVDRYLDPTHFPFLYEVWPFAVDTKPEFTSIQYTMRRGESTNVETAWLEYEGDAGQVGAKPEVDKVREVVGYGSAAPPVGGPPGAKSKVPSAGIRPPQGGAKVPAAGTNSGGAPAKVPTAPAKPPGAPAAPSPQASAPKAPGAPSKVPEAAPKPPAGGTKASVPAPKAEAPAAAAKPVGPDKAVVRPPPAPAEPSVSTTPPPVPGAYPLPPLPVFPATPVGGSTAAVIVPTYNRAHFLVHALDSLLKQTRPPNRLIVVDDGSTDDTASMVASRYGTRVEYRRSAGQVGKGAAVNSVLGSLGTDYVWIFDDDDVAMPNAIQRCVEALDLAANAGYCYGIYQKTESAPDYTIGRNLPRDPVPDVAQRGPLLALMEQNYLGGARLFFRTRALQDLGGFDPEYFRSQDFELAIRLVRAHKGVAVRGGPLYLFRQHDEARGPAAERIAAVDRQRKWLDYDQRIFRHLLPELGLQAFLPPDVPLEPNKRRAHLQRLVILAARVLVPEAVQALDALVALEPKRPATREEVLLASAVRKPPYYRVPGLYETPEFVARLEALAGRSKILDLLRTGKE